MSQRQMEWQPLLQLLLGIWLCALAVSIYVMSDFGVSTSSSVALVLSNIFAELSLGTATIIYQTVLLVVLVLRYGWQKRYLASLVLGLCFGFFVDTANLLWLVIPIARLPRLVLFLLGLLLLPLGITTTIRSQLSGLPFDLFVSDISLEENQPMGRVKLLFDAFNVTVTVILSYVVLGHIEGVGLGTIISVLVNGTLIEGYQKLFDCLAL